MNTIPSIFYVNWGIGTIIIGIFAIVCIVMGIVIYSMIYSGKNDGNAKTPPKKP